MTSDGILASRIRPRPAAAADRERAVQSVATPIRVADADTLARAAETWSECPALGLDTEFVRERTYFALPGLVQISDGRQAWLVDAVALEHSDALREYLGGLLARPDCGKILHATGEDLEVLDRLAGALPDPLFDTQVAAALLGAPLQCRLEHLVAAVLEVDLPGGQARNNWRQRPLPEHLEIYAAQDVVWLPALREALLADLDAHDRRAWLEEDCARLLSGYGTRPEPWLRIKGATRLSDDALPRLRQLAEWREDQAEQRNLPRSFVLKDAVLLGLARKPPASAGDLAQVEGVPAGLVRRHADAVLACLAAKPEPGFRRPPELTELDVPQREVLGQLQTRVRRVAEELGLDPALIASRRELTGLLQTGRAEWLNGWRGEVLGADFVAAARPDGDTGDA